MSAIDDPKANRPVFLIDKDFAEAALRFANPSWELPELSDKQRSFLCMAADMCGGWLGLPFMMHAKMALKSGAKRSELKEVILHAAPDAGFTIALSAMLRLKLFTWWRGFRERKQAPAPSGNAPADIMALFPSDADPELKEQFRRGILPIWQRGGLAFEDRVLITLACDVTQQTLGASFAFHLAIAEAAGIPQARLRKTVMFVAEYAFGKSWDALAAMDDRTSQ
ncbi:MAG: carboxymuconolactone decarboxylase family protein [Gammaproteobacteria bacterium]